jgi:hypothetical protein|tara:strand:- start:56 stop:175 length:120 start_codon:yes stop_codon:yes gene_type:complete
MINILELAGIMIICGACFAMGMYFSTQVGNWINKNINKK